MIQRQRPITKHAAKCPTCSALPKHYIVHGRDQHFYECAPCAVRTARRDTETECAADWNARATERLPVRRIA